MGGGVFGVRWFPSSQKVHAAGNAEQSDSVKEVAREHSSPIHTYAKMGFVMTVTTVHTVVLLS